MNVEPKKEGEKRSLKNEIEESEIQMHSGVRSGKVRREGREPSQNVKLSLPFPSGGNNATWMAHGLSEHVIVMQLRTCGPCLSSGAAYESRERSFDSEGMGR